MTRTGRGLGPPCFIRMHDDRPPPMTRRSGPCLWGVQVHGPAPSPGRILRRDAAGSEPCHSRGGYFNSTVAPCSSSFALIASASSLVTASRTVPGALSTSSLASFRPRLVTSRTTLMT